MSSLNKLVLFSDILRQPEISFLSYNHVFSFQKRLGEVLGTSIEIYMSFHICLVVFQCHFFITPNYRRALFSHVMINFKKKKNDDDSIHPKITVRFNTV